MRCFHYALNGLFIYVKLHCVLLMNVSKINQRNKQVNKEVRKSRVMKLSYETELHKMTSHFELLTRSRKINTYTSSYYLEGLIFIFLKLKNKKLRFALLTRSLKIKSLLRVTNSKSKTKKFHLELLTRRLNRKLKSFTWSY